MGCTEHEEAEMASLPVPNTYYDKLKLEALHELGGQLEINDRFSENYELIRQQFLKGLHKFPYQKYKRFPLLNRKCPFCLSKLVITEKTEEDEDNYVEQTGALEYCRRCRYWQWHYLDTEFMDRGGVYVHQYSSLLSKLRDFDSTLPEGCASDVSQWIRRNPQRWHTMTPRQLEKLVADIFKSNYTHAQAYHVGKPDDGGIDVVFVDTDNKQWLIQVKRREKPNYAEPVETIRNLLGTMVLEKSSLGMVVSTADHFTYRAREAVGRAKECGMTVRLIDRKELDKMLHVVLPDRPWLEPLLKEAPGYAKLFADRVQSDLQLKLF